MVKRAQNWSETQQVPAAPDRAQTDEEQIGQGPQPDGTTPKLIVGAQYLQTTSMATFGAPQVLYNLPPRPHIALHVDVNARQLTEDQPNFEVSLVLRGKGYRASIVPDAPEPEALYTFDLSYGGVFVVQNVDKTVAEALLLVEAPRHLFPSARQILLNLIREAGFPTINIQPIDFQSLAQSKVRPEILADKVP